MSCVQYLNFCYDDCMLKGLGLEGAGLDLDYSPDYIIGMNNRSSSLSERTRTEVVL